MSQYLWLHKQYLVDFWEEYGGPIGRKGVSRKSKEKTIQALIKLGTVILTHGPNARSKEFNRHQYTSYKSKLKGYNGFKHCFACREPAQVRHHIIWIKNGGRNHKKNIVALCRPCHAAVHPWLDMSVKNVQNTNIG